MGGCYEPADGEPQVAWWLYTSAAHERQADPQTRLGFHWKFKNGVFEKDEGRSIARGDYQRPGIGYEESFSPRMRLESLRTILALAAIRDSTSFNLALTQPTSTARSRRKAIWSSQKAVEH